MIQDDEQNWSELRQLWRNDPAIDPALLSRLPNRLRRQTLAMLALSVLEVALALGMTWLAIGVALDHPTAPTLVWAMAVGIFFIAALIFAFYNRMGVWQAETKTTRAFLELSAERARRRVRTVRFTRWLLVAELAFLIPWLLWDASVSAETLASYGLLCGLMAAFMIVVLVWSVWFRRRAIKELKQFEQLQRGLAGR